MAQITHQCIKPSCETSYEDEDPDPYYCFECREQNKKMAAEIDLKVKAQSTSKPESLLKKYDSLPKGKGGFVNAKYFQ